MRIEEWQVLDVAPATAEGRFKGDGDTVWLRRNRVGALGDDLFYISDIKHKSHRLVWVDTPERGEVGYGEADADLDLWINYSLKFGPLKAYVYEGGAGWDRKLCDLVNSSGESASQYLMIHKGWEPYVQQG